MVAASIPSELATIAHAGVLAPSADNRHCFELQATADGIVLLGNDAYSHAPFHRRLLSLISFGAVVENMVIRATRLGYSVDVTWRPDALGATPIAQMRLTKGAPTPVPLDAAIEGRQTNRRLRLSGPRLSDGELGQFQHLLHGINGVTLTFFDTGSRGALLLRLIGIAEAERFNTRELHEDLFSAVRWDAGWHASADEGLPPGALNVEPGARWAFAQLRRWPLMNMLRRLGVHRALGFRAGYLPCRLAPHRGVLTTSLPVQQGAASVGMAMERLWLEAESRQLAFQPFAGAALLALPEYEEVPEKTGKRLREGWQRLTNETPLMVFRMGRAKKPAVRTGRLAVDSYFHR